MGFELGVVSHYLNMAIGTVIVVIIASMFIEMIGRHVWSMIDDANYTSNSWVGDHSLAKLFAMHIPVPVVVATVFYLWVGNVANITIDDGGREVLELLDIFLAIVASVTSMLYILRAIRRQGKMFKKQQ